jgi:long-chain acyl-CoA synthetase
VLLARAAAHPERVRFRVGRDRYRYVDVVDLVARASERLRAAGVRHGDRVALFGASSVEWVAWALGAQALGASFAAIHAGSSRDLAEWIVAHCDARVVLMSRAERERTGELHVDRPVFDIEGLRSAPAPTAELVDNSRPGDVACLIYTSGTTGRPKGVALTHANLAANGDDWLSVCADRVPDGARELSWLPLSHVLGWGTMCIGTRLGFTSTIVEPRDVDRALPRVRPHVLITVPSLVERLTRGAKHAVDLRAATGGSLTLCLCGGASLAPSLKRTWRGAGLPLYEGYGLTETSPTLTLERPGAGRLDTVGAPFPSVELRIADDGEVLARGPNVFLEYWRDPLATRDAFTDDGWFRTGDVGAIVDGGQLKLLDRKKALIALTTGKKVAPQPIEAAAALEPAIERLVVFGEDRPFLGGLVVPDLDVISERVGRPVAATDADVIAAVDEALARLNRSLSHFERVRARAIADRPLTVEEGLLTPSLKVRRERVWSAFAPVVEPLWPTRTHASPLEENPA